MLKAATLVRPIEDLQTSVFLGRAVHGNHATSHVGIQAVVVLVPVSVVLVPLPGATNVRLLHYYLVVEVINLVAEQFLRRADDAFAAHTGAVDIVVELIPNSQFTDAALAVASAVGFFHVDVGLRNLV